MGKKNYLTPEEQRIWHYIDDKEIVDNELIKIIFPEMSINKRNKLLHNLYKKGYLKRAIKDIYYTSNLEDYKKLALRIHKGYIGLTTALRYYRLTKYEEFIIYVITESKYNQIELKNYTLKYIPLKKHYKGYIKKEDIIISTIEKTIFDCFLRIKYINYSNLSQAIYEADINWEKLLVYFSNGPTSTRQKLGYVLELLKKETNFNVPKYVLKNLNRNISSPVKLRSNNKKSKFNKKWKIQDNVGKKKILDWWF